MEGNTPVHDGLVVESGFDPRAHIPALTQPWSGKLSVNRRKALRAEQDRIMAAALQEVSQ